MADVWKIGQDIKASDYYNVSPFVLEQRAGTYGWDTSLTNKANNMTKMCEEMSRAYDQIIEDQNDYYLELDVQMKEIENLQAEMEKEVNKRRAEQQELIKNSGEDGLSEEDDAKVRALGEEIEGLTGETNSKIEGLNNKIATTSEKSQQNIDKAEIATDYGETAVEIGQPLAIVEDKTKSFWRKAFGGWNKSYTRETGKKLVEAGNELLTQVQTSKDIEAKTEKRVPKKSV